MLCVRVCLCCVVCFVFFFVGSFAFFFALLACLLTLDEKSNVLCLGCCRHIYISSQTHSFYFVCEMLCCWKYYTKVFFPIWFNLPSPISHRIIFKTLAVFIIPHIYILYTLICVFLVLEFHIFLKQLQIKKKKQINQLFLLATFTLFFIVYVYERVEEKAA